MPEVSAVPELSLSNYKKERLRELALNLAHANDGTSADNIIKRAEAYFQFLSKND